MVQAGVYKITCKVNSKVYVGSSKNLNQRIKAHKWQLNSGTHPNSKLQNSVNAHGIDNFVFEILEVCEDNSANHLVSREQYWIDEYNCLDPRTGFNLFAPSKASELGNYNNSMACYRASRREGVKENRSKGAKTKYKNPEYREFFLKEYGKYPTIKAEVTNLSTKETTVCWSTREIASILGVHMASILNWNKQYGDAFNKNGYLITILEK